MKKVFALVALFGLVATGAIAQEAKKDAAPATPAPAADGPAPKIVIGESMKDFGSIPKGDVISHDFVIKNEGKADLVIDSVKPSCGCTVADFTKVIKPGESGRATLKVETKNFEGPISKSATVSSNDPANPQMTLVIKAVVKPFVSVLPQGYVRFSGLEGESSTQSVTLVSEEKGPFKIEKVETSKPYVTATMKKLDGADKVPGKGEGDQYKVDITLAKDAPVGLLNEKVTATTNLEKAKTVEVTVSGLVRPIISVTPQKLNFGTINAGGEATTRNVIVSNNREEVKDFKVTKAELFATPAETAKDKGAKALKGISSEISAIQEGSRYQVVLKTAPELEKGALAGMLKIYTNDKDHPVYEVEITGTVQ